MKALVTGASGFIGSNLVRYLEKSGWNAHCLIRPDSDLNALAIDFPAEKLHCYDGTIDSMVIALRDSNPDIVFHLASLFVVDHRPENVDSLLLSNVLTGAHLLEAMRVTNCNRLVNIGTNWQFYHSEEYCPVNLYAATKQCFEDVLKFYTDVHGFRSLTCYLFETYGSGDQRKKILNLMINSIRTKGEKLEMSGGDQPLKFSHVDDVVETLEEMGNHVYGLSNPTQRRFLIDGEILRLKDLVNFLQEIDHSFAVNLGGRAYRKREVMEISAIGNKIDVWRKSTPMRSLKSEVRNIIENI
tara:strand:- start:4612 stop:5508 length:897 start_codon:yes stop_codon:yes gene_type:complete